MIKLSTMISDKYYMYIIVTCFIVSCSKDDNDKIGENGFCLSFNNVPIDTLLVLENDYSPSVINTTCADLHVWMMSTSPNIGGNERFQSLPIERVGKIEQQISHFLDPKGDKYNGMMPLPVNYTIVECKSISIVLYDENNNLVSDITDKARFHYIGDPYSPYEDGCNIVISADSLLIGKMKIGATIKDYLALNPMVFAEAHFLFPDLNKEIFNRGYYAIIEMELSNDKKLKAYSENRNRFKE